MSTTLTLINTVGQLGSLSPARSGESFSDPTVQAQIIAAGGQFALASNSIIAAAATTARKLRLKKGANDTACDVLMLAAFVASGGASASSLPATQAAPITTSYQMLAQDLFIPVAAGAIITLPKAPILGVEYKIKIVSGTAETDPVQVLSGGTYNVEDPGANAAYTYRSGATPATMKTSAACNSWVFDGATMNLTR